MIRFLLILPLIILMPLRAEAAMPLAGLIEKQSTNQLDSSGGSGLIGYSLVTIPSVNRSKVESEYKNIHAKIPDAEIRKQTIEKVVFRLVVQCFDSMAPAKLLQVKLLKSSKTPFVVHTTKSYCVVASSQMTKNAALAEQKQLADKNVSSNIVEVSLRLPHWQVKSGNYQRVRDAVYMANSMSMKGLMTIIEPLDSD